MVPTMNDEDDEPIRFYRGKRHQFDLDKHVEKAFVGGDRRAKRSRFDTYRKLNTTLATTKHWALLEDAFRDPINAVLNLLNNRSVTDCGGGDIVTMISIMFSDNNDPNITDTWYDSLCEDPRLVETFHVVRVMRRMVNSTINVETAVARVVETVLGGGYNDIAANNMRTLQLHWEEEGPTATSGGKSAIVVILENVLALSAQVLEDFLRVLSTYKAQGVPIVVVAGGFTQTTPPAAVLPHAVLRKYVFETVRVTTTQSVKKALLDFLISSSSSDTPLPLQFCPKSLALLQSSVMEGGLSYGELQNALKAATLEYFRSKQQQQTGGACASSPPSTPMNGRRSSLRGKQVPDSSTTTKPRLPVEQYRRNYRIGQMIIGELLRRASKLPSIPMDVRLRLACMQSGGDRIFDPQPFVTVFSAWDDEQVDEFAEYCEKAVQKIEQDYGDASNDERIQQFLLELEKVKHGEINQQQQVDDDDRQKRPVQNGKRVSFPTNNCNRSSRLASLQQEMRAKIIQQSTPRGILKMKRHRLLEAMKSFFKSTLGVQQLAADDDDPISSSFDDSSFLKQILSPSSRELVIAAISAPEFAGATAVYDTYDAASHNIDLSKWFKKFAEDQDQEKGRGTDRRRSLASRTNKIGNSMLAARFYIMLSSLEFIGFITKGRKKHFVTKLCWTTASAA